MSLLDDARTLLSEVGEDGPREHRDYPYSQSWCVLCGEAEPGAPHSATCPWLSMPKIVAALEAAQALVDHGFVASYFDGDYGEYNADRCGPCEKLDGHEPDCRGMALVAALRGEEVRA